VLLVEDNPDTLDALQLLLQFEGALVTTAPSAAIALEHAEAGEFDLVISDIAMPDMDGLQFIKELRRNPRSAGWPAIAVTGFAKPSDARQAMAAGFDAHLSKPLSLELLNDTLKRLPQKAEPQ
jgi:two-component system CheB/CheR fusion protein